MKFPYSWQFFSVSFYSDINPFTKKTVRIPSALKEPSLPIKPQKHEQQNFLSQTMNYNIIGGRSEKAATTACRRTVTDLPLYNI